MKSIQGLAALALVAAANAFAASASSPPASTDMNDGEVRKIDKAAGKLTLQHGEIKNLGMPGMTMVFVVKDKTVLDKLRPGDKVKFTAIDDAGKLTVTRIQVTK